MPDILSLFPAGNLKPKGNGEWCGPCPLCGGATKDGFLVWPDRPKGGAFLCRKCGAQGDGIAFVMQLHGMGYAEACAALGIEAGASRSDRGSRTGARSVPHVARNVFHGSGSCGAGSSHPATFSKPRPAAEPPQLPATEWMQRAAAFLAFCQHQLDTPDARAFLASRCLSVATAHTCGLGWNPADRYELREAWGLPPVQGNNGLVRDKLLLPAGLVIATRRKVGVVALTIRCLDTRPKDRPKYWQVRGSGNLPFVAGRAGLPVALFESALDACLLHQEAADLCAAVACMGSSKPVDTDTAAFIAEAPLVLACPDNDNGGKSAWQRWKAQFTAAICAPAIGGKDLTDAHCAVLHGGSGVTVRQWAEAALLLARTPREISLTIAPQRSIGVQAETRPTFETLRKPAPLLARNSRVMTCYHCPHWLPRAGYGWWCGLCSVSGQPVHTRTVCSVQESAA